MSYQVGKYCYADEASAAFAACATFSPVTAILPNGDVRTIVCSGVVDHSLKLGVSTTDVSRGRTAVTEITQTLTFPPCMQGELVQSWETIAGALLAAWAVCYGIWRVRLLLQVNTRTGD